MAQYEKLGVFYLGTESGDLGADRQDHYMLLNARDLVTHAMCVGMTGSAKTGLGVCLLEEAAMDGIPAIVVDPKGDMGNLLLTFPDLLASDFEPWVHPEEAETEGLTIAGLAEKKASVWRKGLADSDQNGERIRAMKQNVEFALYTPGGQFGRPLSLEGLFYRPSPAVMSDPELFQEVVSTTATSLLHLVGIQVDPVSSREHVLLSLLIRKAWTEGQAVSLASLIHWISKPPITTIGVMDIETYIPEKDRFALALRFNNLLASPAFSAFMEGEPFDIASLLYTPQGKPKISVLTLSHLADAERMFFVALLLNRLVTWMRSEQGTQSLRALFYMDEVFGYFPPVAEPPSKRPLLTLLKTARAYGLGIVLSTQNPADIDYKGLSNVGTWFVGRLTTERDRMKLLEGISDTSIEGASKSELGNLIAGLKPRQFVMRPAKGGSPVLFQTRFCMSYLAGPLTREQIRRLVGKETQAASGYGSSFSAPGEVPPAPSAAPYQPSLAGVSPTPPAGIAYTPEVPQAASAYTPEVPQAPAPVYVAPAEGTSPSYRPAPMSEAPGRAPDEGPAVSSGASGFSGGPGGFASVAPQIPSGIAVGYLPGMEGQLYKPALAGFLNIYYQDDKKGISHTETVSRFTPLGGSVVPVDWQESTEADFALDDLDPTPPSGARYAPLPPEAKNKTSYTAWQRSLVDSVWRGAELTLRRHAGLGLVSQPEESERDFIARVQLAAREKRDQELDVIEEKYEKKRYAMEEKRAKAEERVERVKDQAKDAKRQTAISFGSAILGSILGKSLINQSTIYRSSTAVKSASRAHKSAGNVGRAEESYERVEQQLAMLEEDMKQDLEAVGARYEAAVSEIDTVTIRPLKRDVVVKAFMVAWLPE